MQTPVATAAGMAAYHKRLLGSHDFEVFYDLLDLNENVIGSLPASNGQVDVGTDGYVRRTLSFTLSDPLARQAVSGTDATSDRLYCDRMVRVRHQITVPGYGVVTAVVFVGPITALAISPGEVQVTCKDKAYLSSTGSNALTVKEGTNAAAAIRTLLSQTTGEFRFRLPASTRRLSKDYTVGPSDDASPMKVATSIAYHELNRMRLSYAADGYLLGRQLPTTSVFNFGAVVDLPSTSLDFTTVRNWVRVSGKVVKAKSGATSQVQTTRSIKTGTPLYPIRKGQPIMRPIVITDDAYTKTSQTSSRANTELVSAGQVQSDTTASVIPVFHLDSGDMVTVRLEDGRSTTIRFTDGTIPLDCEQPMSLSLVRKGARQAQARPRSRVIRHKPPKKKK